MSISTLPLGFWIAVFILTAAGLWCAGNYRRAITLPMLAVLGTVTFWYIGDVIYNDYANWHSRLFDAHTLTTAWDQVSIFLVTFILLAPTLHARIYNPRRSADANSKVLGIGWKELKKPGIQNGLTLALNASVIACAALFILALVRYEDRVLQYFFPYLGKHSGPWVTSALGAGLMDAVYALANYFQLLLASFCGVVFALSTNPRTRALALVLFLLTAPFFIFDRTRKFILLICIPGLAAWLFLRLRGGMVMKSAVLIAVAATFNLWFAFIMANRNDVSIAGAWSVSALSDESTAAARHEGLNMFEELSWVIALRESGRFQPGIGENYWANLVNPVPRAIWPDKPLIGIDYALARGAGGGPSDIGVYATLSHGVIGQGVANFGLYLGPAIAALLMALWVNLLVFVDRRAEQTGYLPLYGLGLIITFTMGRDITFLEAYPFAFGLALCIFLNRRHPTDSVHRRPPTSTMRNGSA